MFNPKIIFSRFITITLITIASLVSVLAQLPPPSDQSSGMFSPEIGVKVGGAYSLGDIESINTVNGNLGLRIPLAFLPAGRGSQAGSIDLFYNSKLWNIRSETDVPLNSLGEPESRRHNLISSPYGSWRYGYRYELKVEDREYPILSSYNQSYVPCNNHDAIYYFKLFLIGPSGARQEFRLAGQNDWEGYFAYRPDGSTTNHCSTVQPLHQKMVYYSMDGSYMRLEVDPDSDSNFTNNPWVLYMADGSRVTGGGSVQRIYDRNQNYVEITSGITYNSHNAIRIEDQFQRRVILEFGAAANEDWIHSWGVGGVELVTKVKWKTISVVRSYNNGSNTVPLLARFRSVIDQIILPNSLTYTFGYNAPTHDFSNPNNDPPLGWGELSSITMPSGAQSTYSYTLDGLTTTEPAFVLRNAVSAKNLLYLQENDSPATSVYKVMVVLV